MQALGKHSGANCEPNDQVWCRQNKGLHLAETLRPSKNDTLCEQVRHLRIGVPLYHLNTGRMHTTFICPAERRSLTGSGRMCQGTASLPEALLQIVICPNVSLRSVCRHDCLRIQLQRVIAIAKMKT
jgi:hypothetical protein